MPSALLPSDSVVVVTGNKNPNKEMRMSVRNLGCGWDGCGAGASYGIAAYIFFSSSFASAYSGSSIFLL